MRMRWLVASVLATGMMVQPLASWAGEHGRGSGGGFNGGGVSHSSAVTDGPSAIRTSGHWAPNGTHWGRNHSGWRSNYWIGRWFWLPGFVGFGTYQWDYPYWYDYPTINVTTDYGVIEDVQSALADRGYYHGVIDGILGPESRQAIEAFQSDQGLPVTGQIDGKLLAALRLI
jgi:hypothetical protein